MEEYENIEEMFSRFQTLVAGLEVLNKGYTTVDHVKKIIRSLPQKWRPMVTALKVPRDLNSTTLEELISSLRSYEIELEADEPRKKVKYVALKSSCESEKFHILHSDVDELCSEDVEDEEVSLLARRINQFLKHRQRRLGTFNKTSGQGESTFNQRKLKPDREVIYFECQEPITIEVSAPNSMMKHQRTSFLRRRFLMATWDDFDGHEE
jgi:hypothetical protein